MRCFKFLVLIFVALVAFGCGKGTEIGTPEPVEEIILQLQAAGGGKFGVFSDGKGFVTVEEYNEKGEVVEAVTVEAAKDKDGEAEISVTFLDGISVTIVILGKEVIKLMVNGAEVDFTIIIPVEKDQVEEKLEDEETEEDIIEDDKGEVLTAKKYISVSVGKNHSCALEGGGSVWCWGSNIDGQLSGDYAGEQSSVPVRVKGVNSAKSVAAGATNTCVIDAEENVLCWGMGLTGVKTVIGSGDVSKIVLKREDEAAVDVACILKKDGSVGRGSVVSASFETVITSDIIDISYGPEDAFALENDGSVWQLPTDMAPFDIGQIEGAEFISAGAGFTYLLDSSGSVFYRSGPAQMTKKVDELNSIKQISAAGGGVYAVSASGVVSHFEAMEGLVKEMDTISNVTSISAGSGHSCAIEAEETIYCWGQNGRGQLGDGSVISSTQPVQVKF